MSNEGSDLAAEQKCPKYGEGIAPEIHKEQRPEGQSHRLTSGGEAVTWLALKR